MVTERTAGIATGTDATRRIRTISASLNKTARSIGNFLIILALVLVVILVASRLFDMRGHYDEGGKRAFLFFGQRVRPVLIQAFLSLGRIQTSLGIGPKLREDFGKWN